MDEILLKERLVELTRDLVLIESTDERPEERRRCFQLVRNHLEALPALEISMVEQNGYESMIAMPAGVSTPEVLLCAHLDVVQHPEPDSYRSELRDGRIYGPGTGDMKGQLAILIELMHALHHQYPGIPLGMTITSDEERGGQDGVKYLVETLGLRCSEAIIPDGGSLNRIIIEEKGIIHLELVARGVSAHAARPWLGQNALEILYRDIERIKRHFTQDTPVQVDPDDHSAHWFDTCTPTLIETSNDSPNRIPEYARAVLDIRFVPPRTVDSVLAEIRSKLSDQLEASPIVEAEPTHLAPDGLFVQITEAVTGKPATLERASGGSDGRFFCARGIPVMLSGPRVGNLHGRDEWVDIDSMVAYFKICQTYIPKKCLG